MTAAISNPFSYPMDAFLWTDLWALPIKGIFRMGTETHGLRLPLYRLLAKPKQLQELKNLSTKHANVIVIQLDTTDPASVNSSVKEVEKRLNGQPLDLLINNAGVLTHNSLETETSEDMLRVYNLNVVGPMLVTQAYYSLLKRAEGTGQAAVVHISALLGSLEDLPHLFSSFPVISYRCSKAALNMLSRCHAEGYKQDGIITIAIHPGWVKTDMGGDQAPLTKEESVRSMMKIISTLNEKQSSTFVDWEGKIIPW
ncbi:C-signal-like isoform X2 [Rhinoderma darwinii]|uniref:C-signal-like isoform X2 n=1 Tax=Rhinoderma darwinii TaxID=43563 RepID=UPI003F666970